MEKLIITAFNFQLFAAGDVVHTTTNYANANNPASSVAYTNNQGLVAENKVFYDKQLIKEAEPLLPHAKFGQKRPIPKNGGKTIEFRKFDSLPKQMTPLTEGVTPQGQSMNVTTITDTLAQYGGYIEYSDALNLTSIDNIVSEGVSMIGQQAGKTLDTVIREKLNVGTNVQYASGRVAARNLLVGGAASDNDYLTVDCIRKAVRTLKAQNAPKIDGYYVAIIHPNVAYDLQNDPQWQYPHQYQDTTEIYNGELGRVAGVRFVESTEAKIFEGAGADGRDVYSTLVLGNNAYGVTEITGGGLQHIIKQLGSGGATDPLNQRATIGWKAIISAVILVQQYMVRIETTTAD